LNIDSKNILLATDFSEISQNAAFYTLNLLNEIPHNLTLINVIEKTSLKTDLLISIHDILMEEAANKLKEEAKKTFQLFNNSQIRIIHRSDEIDAEEYLIKLLKKRTYSLITLGIKNNGTIEGSIASLLLQQPWSPVLLVPQHINYTKPKEVVIIASDTKLKEIEIQQNSNSIYKLRNDNIQRIIFHREDTENYWIELINKLISLHHITKIIFIISQGDALDNAFRKRQMDKIYTVLPSLIIRC